MTAKRKHIFVIIIVIFSVLLFFYYRKREEYVPMFYEMYASVRIECSDDEDIFKYSNNQDLLILTLDGFKNSSIKTDEIFEEEWKYKIILGYNLEEPDNHEKTTEILFKSNSMTIDGVEYIKNSEEEYMNMIDAIEAYYQKNDFIIYKKGYNE